MQYAFDYFHVQAKLHSQRAVQPGPQQQLQDAQQGLQTAQRRLQVEQQGSDSDTKAGSRKDSVLDSPSDQSNLVTGKRVSDSPCKGLERNKMQKAYDLSEKERDANGQRADLIAQQARLAEALCHFEPVWQFDPPLKPTDAQYVVNLPRPPNHSVSDSQYQQATEPFTHNQWIEPDPVHYSCKPSPPEPPPQTLFAQSTPHAREIQAQPRLKSAVKGLQPWYFQSQVTNGDAFRQCLSPTQPADPAMTLPGSHHQSPTCTGTILPQTLVNKVDISDRASEFRGSNSLPSSYAGTVFPQTLNRKDRRILGVSLSASIDE